MTQTPDPTPNPPPPPDPSLSDTHRILEKESLGEFFRKMRISNRIDIPKMAKETRLAAEYLQAIEKNEFEKLPGETYRKIFIKSVAKYLELDPEEMYARYLRETQPQPAEEAKADEPPAPRKSETRSSTVLSQSASMRPLLITLGAIFVVLLIILSRTGPSDAPPPFPTDTAAAVQPADSAPEIDSTVFAPAPPESLLPLSESSGSPRPAAAPAPAPAAPDTAARNAESRRFWPETEGALKIELLCTRDSVYVNAFRNEKSWFNLFRSGEKKVFAGDTAIWFRISTPEWVTLRAGAVDRVPAPLKNKPVLRVDAEGITYHPVRDWDRLTRRR